ncbi:hypothetical protein BO70DRAFT_302134 [Aspergillus heteromorphus CBS 117.55]|uniref:Uncharacterized protein n=1 Tax=Aspergillus heteromorphus CBS 117.55 TaxID=1448321 RepID=A0A317UYW9_9EURO|nr:uncharacterized protein BO70DRAFT_302134 [Aspergillus heteromorphus CBS 117.55]PWY65692.1 hypothetical protein BO70DRAFT_302134 [Aspergillus heteromorphus CBS 117.55]
MSRGRTLRDWDADESHKRVAVSRRGSDTDYDIRVPRSSHVDAQPEPSYYGPNFVNSEQGRSSSLAYGDIREPKMPDPWKKAPQPYPEGMNDQYLTYKDYGDQYSKANRAFKLANPLATPDNHPNIVEKVERGLALAAEARTAANLEAAARSGFDHKFPYAYDSLAKKASHKKPVKEKLEAAKKIRKNEGKLHGKLPADYYEKQP